MWERYLCSKQLVGLGCENMQKAIKEVNKGCTWLCETMLYVMFVNYWIQTISTADIHSTRPIFNIIRSNIAKFPLLQHTNIAKSQCCSIPILE